MVLEVKPFWYSLLTLELHEGLEWNKVSLEQFHSLTSLFPTLILLVSFYRCWSQTNNLHLTVHLLAWYQKTQSETENSITMEKAWISLLEEKIVYGEYMNYINGGLTESTSLSQLVNQLKTWMSPGKKKRRVTQLSPTQTVNLWFVIRLIFV